VRLFLAIDPGEECRRRLASVVAAVRASASGVRWVRDGKLHVTLAFFGEVAEARVDEVRVAAQRVVAHHQAFSATVSGGGVFPDWRRPRVVWLGLGDNDHLMALGNEIGLMATTLGFAPDHSFRAHLTIGRIPRPLSAEQRVVLRSALGALSGAYPFDVTRVVLMRSAISPAGSEYSELASFPLGDA
jgi:RNA 2',3'-cyclic 3'-phosphodiesterase